MKTKNVDSTIIDEILNILSEDSVLTVDQIIDKISISDPQSIIDGLIWLVENNNVLVKEEGSEPYFSKRFG